MRVYILGLKQRHEDHYGLTTWFSNGEESKYAIYDHNPGYWHKSLESKPLGIYNSEQEAIEAHPTAPYVGFGWVRSGNSKVDA